MEESAIPEPLKTILRDYLYVEWYELDELTNEIASSSPPAWSDNFQTQLKALIASNRLPLAELNIITGQEFQDEAQLKAWLKGVQLSVFGE